MPNSFQVKSSKIHGVGVFAKKDFNKGDVLFGAVQLNPMKTTSLGSKVNHSEDNNIRLKKSKDSWDAVATKNILNGDEIVSNYDKEDLPVDRTSSFKKNTNKYASIYVAEMQKHGVLLSEMLRTSS